jgi:hypothetical protein
VDPGASARADRRERIDALYLAPTLFDLVHHRAPGSTTSIVRAVAYAGSPMTKRAGRERRRAFDPRSS